MKLYFAITYLDRSEWAGDTVWSAARNGFELCLRKFLKNEGGDDIAAHVSLYFENVPESIQRDVQPLLPPKLGSPTSFFIDVLSNGHHEVSATNDPQNWYRRWAQARVELYPVSEVDANGNAMDALRAYESMIHYVKHQPPYDCYQNCNSICSWPTRCSPSCGCCCPCFNGTNCIEAVVVSLASGYAAPEWRSQQALGIPKRASRGARLPATLRDELVDSGIAVNRPRELLMAPDAMSFGVSRSEPEIPLLAVIIR
jgi:hypothetical protein